MKAKYHPLVATGHAVAAALQTIAAAGATPGVRAAVAALADILRDIETHADRQAAPLTGKTRDRNALFLQAAAAAHIVARLVLGHALDRGDDDLAARVDIAASAYRRGRLAHRLELMRQVHAAAGDAAKLGPVLGATPEVLAELDAKITAAEAVLTLPRTNIANRCVATKNLHRSLQALRTLLKYTLDPLMALQRETDPQGYALYTAARLVITRSRERAGPSAPAPELPATTDVAPPAIVIAPGLQSSASVTVTLAAPVARAFCPWTALHSGDTGEDVAARTDFPLRFTRPPSLEPSGVGDCSGR